MNRKPWHYLVSAGFGVAIACAAQGASFDVNRILGVGKDLVTATSGINEKQEIAIGAELAGRTLGAAPLVNDPELQSYVNKVGRWVASQSERPDLPWRFGVIDTASVNAFAVPGGYVLITRGLYDMLENESQLAGVLGHEIGHIVRRHHIIVMQKSAGVSALAGAGQEALAARGGRSTPALNQILGTGAEVLARGLDKDAEYEADHLGVVLAARAGYSPYGLVDVLHKLRARGASDASLALLFATHPAAGDRLGKLGEAMTPRIATLPAGRDPRIRSVAANVPPAPARAAAETPAGARAFQDSAPHDSSQPGGGPPATFDAGGLLRGIFGR